MVHVLAQALRPRHEVLVTDDLLLDLSTSRNLLDLGVRLLPPPTPEDKKPLSSREYKKRFEEWRANPPQKIKQKGDMLNISRGFAAGDAFYRETFATLHPEWVPTGKIGRPEGYSPRKQLRIAKGLVITRLLELAGDALRAEIEAAEHSDTTDNT